MPFRRYECRHCGKTFRVLENGSVPPAVCPHCGERDADRLLPRIGVIYKGKGYYSTDYRRRERGRSPRSTKSEAARAASNAESPGDG